jgi:phosphopantothenoylcysteine decarboxylase/phosphopantothenate--cysteine ligase
VRIVLGVAGGIAAYKACSLLRLMTEGGHDVTVVPTAAALRFVGAPTWEALSGKRVHTEVWSDITEVPHVRIGQEADLVVVAPATADLLARAATGQADDLLTNVLLTARCPVVMAPAMHTEMWDHPATQANVATLTERGVRVIPPASGRLTGKDTGPGRLPEPEAIFAVVEQELAHGARPHASAPSQRQDLHGIRVVVSAGGTREPLDPVRFLGNRSSGKQGYAIAADAAARGADVTLVSANVTLAAPPGAHLVEVGSAQELADAVTAAAANADVVVMAAAVADFRPAEVAGHKIKKSHEAGREDDAPVIELVRNPDILRGLVVARGEASSPLIVGFAAETGEPGRSVLDLGRDKLDRKGCDLLVVNEVGVDKTFGLDDNTVTILSRDGSAPVGLGPGPKSAIAHGVVDAIAALLAR